MKKTFLLIYAILGLGTLQASDITPKDWARFRQSVRILQEEGVIQVPRGNNSFYGTQKQIPVPRRTAIKAALNSIVLPKAGPYESYTMDEILEVLNEIAVLNHIAGTPAINFAYIPQLGHKPAPPLSPPNIDPTTGLPLPMPPITAQTLQIDPTTGLPIPFTPPPPQLSVSPILPVLGNNRPEPTIKRQTTRFRHITLKMLLDILTMHFDPPMGYSIMDWGVVFYEKDPAKAHLIIRNWQVSPKLFPIQLNQHLGNTGPGLKNKRKP